MSNPSKQSIFNSSKIFKATNVKKVHPIYQQLAESLSHIDILKFIKIYNGRLCVSNLTSENKKKEPITKIGEVGVVGGVWSGVLLMRLPQYAKINFI
jgi:hypothetical protein